MGYRDKPHVAKNMPRTVLTVYPKELDKEPRAGDFIELTGSINTASGASFPAGTVLHLLEETLEEPHGMADPYYSNFRVETPRGVSIWSSIRLMLVEQHARILPRRVGAAAMVLQS